MKKRVLALSALLAFCGVSLGKSELPAPKPSLEPINAIVAVVNKDIITKEELDRAVQSTKLQFEKRGIPLPSNATMQKKTLDSLIDEKLQLSIAAQNQITASDEEVAEALNNIADRNHFSLATLKEKIALEGISFDEFRQQIVEQLTISHLQQQALAAKMTLTPSDVSAFQQQFAKQNQTVRYHLVDYIAAEKAKADSLLTQLKNKNTAIDLAGVQVQQMGWRDLDAIPDVFATRVVDMNDQQVVGPIATSNGYHVLKLLETKKEANELSDQQAKEILYQKKFQEALKQWLLTLRGDAYIKNYLPS